ncbi:hypothetical protein GKR75_07820 [Providencia sp. wls1919]|nr:hypothetical protein [Providencia sp. wls1919]
MSRLYVDNDGVSLDFIVVNGTTNGGFKGVGIGMGGPGIISGDLYLKSKLAQELQFYMNEPRKPFIGSKIDLSALVIIFVAIILCKYALPDILTGEDLVIASYVTTFVSITIAVLYVIFFQVYGRKDKISYTELKEEYDTKKSIYSRLRFIERDFVLYDPLSKKSIQASKSNLKRLIEYIYVNNYLLRAN